MRLFVVLAVLAVAAATAIFATLQSFHHFADIERMFAGACTPVTGIAGPEDIEIDAARRRAFISSLDRRADDARGAIHLFNLDDPLAASGWRDITDGAPEAFRPLGMDYYEDDDVRRLFVVNGANNAVEMFEVGEDGSLVHLETFAERRLTSPNNIAAVGRRSFYVTNDLKAGRGSWLAPLQFLTRAAAGQVLFTDGGAWRVAADKLRYANGVELSRGGERLYVAETAGQSLRVFARDPETNNLALANTYQLDAAPDNIAVDDVGAIWIAARPKPLTTLRHKKSAERFSPSEVIRIGADNAPTTIYRDDGEELSASAGVARFGPMLLIGALYDDKFLICDLPEDAI